MSIDKHDMTNAKRAYRGWIAMHHYSPDTKERELALRDLLADLMHYSDEYAINFANELRIARDNYADETTPAKEG